jgi:hypothetical protein
MQPSTSAAPLEYSIEASVYISLLESTTFQIIKSSILPVNFSSGLSGLPH